MRLLLDSCVWGGAVKVLRQSGHDVDWCGVWPEDPGDAEILRIATEQARILVTLDKDFGELAIVGGIPHNGIIRLVDFAARQQAPACSKVLAAHGEELMRGAIVTAEPGRLRIRPAD